MSERRDEIFEDTPALGRHMQRVRPWPDIIQLEITSVCNLRCVMCPVTCEKRDRAPDERVLSLSDLRGLREVFENAYEVELTGFGEIFTHPELIPILRFFRECGLSINATTNGMLMAPELSEVIVREGLIDLLCISMDAATQETLAEIRVGAKMDRILANARALQGAKDARNTKLPRLHLSFIAMEQNVDELPAFVRLASELRAQEVVVQGLCAPDTAPVSPSAKDAPREAAVYSETRQEAARLGVPLEFWYQGNEGAQVVDGKTLRKYQVTSRPDEGRYVKDCPFPWDRVFLKSNLDVQICATLWEEMVMGNLRNQSFQDIWLGDAYREARDRMRSTSPPPACEKCITKHWRKPVRVGAMNERLDFGDPYSGQLGIGFYPAEPDDEGRGHRWVRKEVTFFLGGAPKPVLELDVHFHPQAPPVKGEVVLNGEVCGTLDSRTHWSSPARIALPDVRADISEITLRFDREWRPAEHGLPGGHRPLAAMLYSAGLVDFGKNLRPISQAGGPEDAQFISGWYAPEEGLDGARWSQADAAILLPPSISGKLLIETIDPPGAPPREMTAFLDGKPVHRFVAGKKTGAWTARFPSKPTVRSWHVLRLVCQTPWQPAKDGGSADTRTLGILVRRVGWDDRGLLGRLLGRGERR